MHFGHVSAFTRLELILMCQRVVSNLALVTVGGQLERCDLVCDDWESAKSQKL